MLRETAFYTWHFDNLPGNNPKNWPIGLDKFVEKLVSLPELELFHEPFDLDDHFRNRSRAYVDNTINSLKKEKNVTPEHPDVHNLLLALNAIL